MCVGDAQNFFDHPGGYLRARRDTVRGAVTGGALGGSMGAQVGGASGAASDFKRNTEARYAEMFAPMAIDLVRQQQNTPDLAAYRRGTKRGANASLLTSPSGIDLSAMNLGRSTLMGS